MNEFVVNELVKRRADLACGSTETQDRLAKLVHDLEALDEVILQFAPGFELATIKEGVPAACRLVETSRDGPDHHGHPRQAAEPLSTRDVTVALFTHRALNQGNEALFRLMTKRVAVSLRDYRNKGVVRSLDGRGCTICGR